MEEKEKLVYDNFIRQRRNLMAISLVLFFYISSGIVIDTINILGNSFKITSSSNVGSFLHILWVYFSLRYYQYFRHLSLTEIEAERAKKMEKFISAVGVKLLKKRYGGLNKVSLSDDYAFREKGTWMVDIAVKISDEQPKRERINIDTKHLIVPWLKSSFHVAINTRFTTEYFLPFFVAALPLLSILYESYLFISSK